MSDSLVVARLSPEQQAIVDAPVAQRLLVLAGAGTGKTEVLVERARRLVERDDVAPGQELLVLSFTRATVGELKRRTGLTGGRARFVRPITFDSFATRTLARFNDQATADWRELGYDGRIAAATKTLATTEGRDALAEYVHVFVDEIQDLVGVRASMVTTILENVAGFTLLGDPAQAIYDHQVRNEPDKTSSAGFLDQVRRGHSDLRTLVLEENFRGRNAEVSEINRIGMSLRDIDVDRRAVACSLADVYRALEPLGSFEDLAVALRGVRRPTAVLCRSNIDALRVSQHLYRANVEHRLQREATDRALPAWLGILFRNTDRTSWSRRRLEEVTGKALQGIEAPDTDTVWQLLAETVGNDDLLELEKLRRRIASGIIPDELVAPTPAVLVVSTIHRSKGLEFDVVFTPRPSVDVEDQDDLEELRILYVALSRAREELWTFPLPPAEPWRRDPAIGDRWVRSTWRERWKTCALELRPDDIVSRRPFGTGLIPADAGRTQDYLADQVKRGDPIDLRLFRVRDAEEPIPFYRALHSGYDVGETSEELGRALARRLQRPSASTDWPTHLTGAICDGIETVLGMTSEGSSGGLGSSGLWLRPRLVGLADLRWNDDERTAIDDDSR